MSGLFKLTHVVLLAASLVWITSRFAIASDEKFDDGLYEFDLQMKNSSDHQNIRVLLISSNKYEGMTYTGASRFLPLPVSAKFGNEFTIRYGLHISLVNDSSPQTQRSITMIENSSNNPTARAAVILTFSDNNQGTISMKMDATKPDQSEAGVFRRISFIPVETLKLSHVT